MHGKGLINIWPVARSLSASSVPDCLAPLQLLLQSSPTTSNVEDAALQRIMAGQAASQCQVLHAGSAGMRHGRVCSVLLELSALGPTSGGGTATGEHPPPVSGCARCMHLPGWYSNAALPSELSHHGATVMWATQTIRPRQLQDIVSVMLRVFYACGDKVNCKMTSSIT